MNVANVVPWLFPKLGKEAFGSEIPHTPVQQRNSDQRDPRSALPDHMDSTAWRTYPRFARTPSSNTPGRKAMADVGMLVLITVAFGRPHLLPGHRPWPRCRTSLDAGRHGLLMAGPIGQQFLAQIGEVAS